MQPYSEAASTIKPGDTDILFPTVTHPGAAGWHAAGQRDVLSPLPYPGTCSQLSAGKAQLAQPKKQLSQMLAHSPELKATSEHTCNRAGVCPFASSMKVLWKPVNSRVCLVLVSGQLRTSIPVLSMQEQGGNECFLSWISFPPAKPLTALGVRENKDCLTTLICNSKMSS